MGRFSLCIVAIIGIMTLTDAKPHPHHQSDPYSPVIDFLKQLRKARKHGGGAAGNREDEASSSSSISFEQQPQGQGQQQQGQQQSSVPILYPSNSQNDQRITIQLPQNLPTRPPSSPADIQRVNNGVSTILQGVRSFDLGAILRGAFTFPRNENVKSVANNVLDNIFGPINGAGSSGSQSPTSQN